VRELTLGVAPEFVAVELRASLDTINYRRTKAADFEPELYDWSLNKSRYITLLREYDVHRNATDLAAFVGVRPLSA